MKTYTQDGITYQKPKVILLQETGIGTAEYAARTCYDSFDSSENHNITNINAMVTAVKSPYLNEATSKSLNDIEHSDLLDTLAWTHFHYSILEHANLTYLIKGTSRGVLQEHARHRIQAISVRSTRYTMSSVLNAFVASVFNAPEVFNSAEWFITKMLEQDLLVTKDVAYARIEYKAMFSKLLYQMKTIGEDEFKYLAVPKSSLQYVNSLNRLELYDALEAGKKKRNVGDSFKHIITDNVKVDMVVTFNLRSLKNYFQLRDSGAAYFQIKHLAQAMKAVTPSKYLDLIVKQAKECEL